MSEEEMKALVEMNNMLKHENEKLKQENEQLKRIVGAYKEKEDKLREYIKSNWVIDEPIKFKNDILDILNEGDK